MDCGPFATETGSSWSRSNCLPPHRGLVWVFAVVTSSSARARRRAMTFQTAIPAYTHINVRAAEPPAVCAVVHVVAVNDQVRLPLLRLLAISAMELQTHGDLAAFL